MNNQKKRHQWTQMDEIVVYMSSQSDVTLSKLLGMSHGSIHARRWNMAYVLSKKHVGLKGMAQQTIDVVTWLGLENAGKQVISYLTKTLISLVKETGVTRVAA